MNLTRTRTRSFAVGSPRKGLTPLKHKHGRNPPKRRKISLGYSMSRPILVSEDESDDTLDPDPPQRRPLTPLSSEVGSQLVNKKTRRNHQGHGHTDDGRWKGKARDTDESSEEESPRKRKRDEIEVESETDSWVEMEEPEYIAESESTEFSRCTDDQVISF